jgi:putative heme iron utilization protein
MRKEGERTMADPTPDPFWQARLMLRAARAATLATATEGQPLASLTIAACAPDLSLLLLLSDLSDHTRHLRQEPRCSLMVVGAPGTANPMTAPRTSVTGLAEISADPALKARYLAIHPYAALYADFGDFNLWRIRPLGGQFVGGFARAQRLRREHLTPDPAAVARLQAAEAEICAHCNTDHPDTLALIAGRPGDWRMVTADVDGCDLAQDEHSIRIAWSAPVDDAGGVRKELIRLAREARK